jgi:uncharacterized protein
VGAVAVERSPQTITAFVADGGGLVGNHTASICFDDWPAWGEVLGGAWAWGRSSHPPQAPVTVEVVDTDHPVTSGLPPRWDLVDEVYGDLDLQPDLDVLAVARRHPTTSPSRWCGPGPSAPVAWSTTGSATTSPRSTEPRARAPDPPGRGVGWARRSREQEVRA